MGFTPLALAYLEYGPGLNLKVYDFTIGRHDVIYLNQELRKNAKFVKNGLILTKLDMLVHIDVPSDLMLQCTSVFIENPRWPP